MSRILYLSLTGMAEPLGQSQVLEYLTELVKTHEITLFSFERKRHQAEVSRLKTGSEFKKIKWIRHTYYSFGLLSTAYMLSTAFCRLFYITLRFRPKIIHARSFLPALLGWPLARLFGAKLVYDIRGFAMDEKVDSGQLKKTSLLYKLFHRVEGFLYRKSDHIVTLTHASKDILCQEFCLSNERVTVIPTCANKALFYPLPQNQRQILRQKHGFSSEQKILIHTGAVSGWYDFEKEVALFAKLHQYDKNYHFIVLNKEQQSIVVDTFKRYAIPVSAYTLLSVPFQEVVNWLNMANAALFFVKPSYAKQASAPTKFAEMVACHLPSIVSGGVGDMDFYLKQYSIGVLLDLAVFSQNIDKNAKEINDFLTKEIDKQQYEFLFSQHFDKVLAVKRYHEIYSAHYI